MFLTPGSPVRRWLLWAAFPYGLAAKVRAFCYDRGIFARQRLSVPVFSVGNLTLGGTGKTPIVIWLTQLLLAEGRRVAVLSRGYRRTSREPILIVSDGTTVLVGPEEAGDEPYLVATRCPRAVVAVGPDRYQVGLSVLKRFPVDCVVLDDGFQHLGLHREVNLLLIDATDQEGIEAVVPAGRLREPLGAARRATMIVVTRADEPADVSHVIHRLRHAIGAGFESVEACFRPEGLCSLSTGEVQLPAWCRGKRALLCSGIGHAASFRALAEAMEFSVVEEVRFEDHHRYTLDDIERLREKAKRVDVLVTTEKDAGKLESFLLPGDHKWWAIRLTTELTDGEDRLRRAIRQCLAGDRVEVCA